MLTAEDMKALSDLMDQKIDPIYVRLDAMDQRFDGIDKRLDAMDQRFDGIDKRLDGMDQHFDGIDQRLDNIEDTLEELKEESAITRSATNTLLEWAEQAQVNVQVPLFRKAE